MDFSKQYRKLKENQRRKLLRKIQNRVNNDNNFVPVAKQHTFFDQCKSVRPKIGNHRYEFCTYTPYIIAKYHPNKYAVKNAQQIRKNLSEYQKKIQLEAGITAIDMNSSSFPLQKHKNTCNPANRSSRCDKNLEYEKRKLKEIYIPEQQLLKVQLGNPEDSSHDEESCLISSNNSSNIETDVEKIANPENNETTNITTTTELQPLKNQIQNTLVGDLVMPETSTGINGRKKVHRRGIKRRFLGSNRNIVINPSMIQPPRCAHCRQFIVNGVAFFNGTQQLCCDCADHHYHRATKARWVNGQRMAYAEYKNIGGDTIYLAR